MGGDHRGRIIEGIKERYQVPEEHLWQRSPEAVVFRHQDNRKWFALFMTVAGEKMGVSDEWADILDLRCPDFLLRDVLLSREGYRPAYHMHKGNWITVLLDGSVPEEEIWERVEESFLATASKEVRERSRAPKSWLIPANPKYYDVEEAFRKEKVIDWKQGRGIQAGDLVYMYVAAPVSAVLYACRVMETDIPFLGEAEEVNITSLMRIELLRTYAPEAFPLEKLRSVYGVKYVRGPRGVPVSLLEDLER